jgi:hypothetical protein
MPRLLRNGFINLLLRADRQSEYSLTGTSGIDSDASDGMVDNQEDY